MGRVGLPLTAAQLAKLQSPLKQLDLPSPDKMAIWAALSQGYHAFLRVSEFTSPTTTNYSPEKHLLRRDVKLHKRSLTLTIKASKSDPYRVSCTLPVGATDTPTCPVRAVRKFLSKAKHRPSRPLFTLSSGEFLTWSRLTSILRKLLRVASLTSKETPYYGSHSLRIGAATDAAAAGLPSWLIQAARHWKSTAYKRYIRSPKHLMLQVAPTLVRQAETKRGKLPT